MSLLVWLSNRAPDLDTPPPAQRISANLDPTEFGDIADDEVTTEAEEVDTYEIDEMFCVIDYCSAAGETTRRRVTLRKIARGPHAPILSAICHERRAFRQFRCDRIECFIDPDGEVFSCADFFRDQLSIDLDSLAPNAAQQALPVARQMRDRLRPPLSLLITAAHADGEFHPEELDVICQYIETELFKSERYAELRDQVTIDVLDQLTELLRHMRPQRGSIYGYLNRVLDFASEDIIRFSRALENVVLADGRVRKEEEDFIEDLVAYADAREEAMRRRLFGEL